MAAATPAVGEVVQRVKQAGFRGWADASGALWGWSLSWSIVKAAGWVSVVVKGVGQNWVSRHVRTTCFQLVIDLSITCKPRSWANNAI
jgi:hypothetical protein